MSIGPEAVAPADERVALSHRQILVILTGLMLGILLAALDQTIVSTALPTIVGDLGGINRLSWVVTAYLIASTTTTPIYGKLGDLYGRKIVFQFAISLFLVGSALSGLAHTMTELIIFRAVQGLGSGGIVSQAMAIIGDILSPRERGKYQGYTMGVWTFASVSGPAVGGLLTEHLSWRWCFYVNLPLGAIALVVTSVVLNLSFTRVRHHIDYSGALVLVLGVVSLLFVSVLGGGAFAWSSVQILGLLAAAVVLLVGFVLHERRTPDPLLPLRLFANPTFRIMNLAAFLSAAAMFGTTVYLPLFLQLVTGVQPALSGILIMPQSVSSMIAGVWMGRRITKTGHYRVYPLVASVLMTCGIVLLSTMTQTTPRYDAAIFMMLFGLGTGMIMPVQLVAIQNAVSRQDLGTATASNMFFRQMGSSFGVAVFGSVMNARLRYWIPRLVPSSPRLHLSASSIAYSPAQVRRLPLPVRNGLIEAFARSLHVVFLSAAPLTVLGFIVLISLKELPLRTAAYVRAADAAGAGMEGPIDGLGPTPDAESVRAGANGVP